MVKATPPLIEQLIQLLDRVLREPGGPSQREIADICNVHQALVSRALNGELKRETKRVRLLYQKVHSIYANMRNIDQPLPPQVKTAVAEYLAAGGDTDVLVRQLDILRLARSPLRRSEMPKRTVRASARR